MDWTRGHSPLAASPAGASAKEAILLRVLSLTRASRMTSAPYLPPQLLAVLFVGRFATTRRPEEISPSCMAFSWSVKPIIKPIFPD